MGIGTAVTAVKPRWWG